VCSLFVFLNKQQHLCCDNISLDSRVGAVTGAISPKVSILFFSYSLMGSEPPFEKVHLLGSVEILKSQLATKFTIQNNSKADISEILPAETRDDCQNGFMHLLKNQLATEFTI